MTMQIANLQAYTTNTENVKFFVFYIKKEMRIMRLQMEAEGETESRSGGRQGGGDVERIHAMSQNDGNNTVEEEKNGSLIDQSSHAL